MSETPDPTEADAGEPSLSDRTLRAFVISDIHAVADEVDRHASGARKFAGEDPKTNALVAVREVIREQSVRADLVLCPGDLAHADRPGGPDIRAMEWAWEELRSIADELDATLIATAGNHDICRLDTPADPSRFLRALHPPFPTLDTGAASTYFEDGFVAIRGDDYQVVALNTCAEHDVDHERGSVRLRTIQKLADDIRHHRRPVNILLCHHHPVQWTHLNRSATDHMRLGEQLLAVLDTDPGRWIVLHGHRHIPAIGYVGESTSGPVRFSAGSVSCGLLHDIGIAARNQFYLLEFDVDELERLNLPGGGRFVAWDWLPTVGARPARSRWTLPHAGGFGLRRDGFELARHCRAHANENALVKWADLLSEDPSLAYVAPVDLQAMVREIEITDGRVLFSADGRIEEIHYGLE